MNTFSILFLIALAAMLIAEFLLGRRQIKHVARHRDAVPATFADDIDLQTHQKAADYTIARTRFGLLTGIYAAAVLLVMTLGGGLEWIEQLRLQFVSAPLLGGTVFIFAVALVSGILDLPVTLYKTFRLESRFGFNKTTPALFVSDMVKSIILMLAIGTPLILAALWLMELSGTWWWLHLWLLWVAFNLAAIWAYPNIIAPLFNRFEPLKDDSVTSQVTELLDRTGFKSRGLFVVDGSRRSAHSNAYFTGLGRSKRVVFFDTLLETLNADEIVAVLAHELGHFKRKHIVKRIGTFFLLSLVSLAVLGWLIQQTWFFTGLGMSTPSNHAALVLFMLAGPVFLFFIQPISAWVSRKHEFEADDFASQHAQADDLVSALLKLYRDNANTLTPDPVYSAFYDSHPPASIRIKNLLAHS